MDRLALILLLLYFVEILGLFTIATLVILRKRTPLCIGFATFTYLAGAWQLLQFVSQLVSSNHAIAVGFLRASVFVSAPMAAAFLMFALLRSERRPQRTLYFSLAFVAGSLSLFSKTLQDVRIDYMGIGVPKLDLWYSFPLLFGGFCVFKGVLAILLHLKKTRDSAQRRGDFILLVSMFCVGLLVIFFSFYSSEFSQGIIAEHILPAATLLLVASFFYAIYQGLFDIHLFVVRALTYLVTLFGLTVGFMVPLLLAFAFFLDFTFTAESFAVTLFASLAALYLLLYVRKLFDSLTAKLFYRQFYNPEDVLDRLSNALATTIELEVLRKSSTDILAQALNPGFLHFVLRDSEDEENKKIMATAAKLPFGESNVVVIDELGEGGNSELTFFRRQRAAIVVRLRTTHDDLGYLLLGYRQSGVIYSSRDVRLLNTAAHESALAIQNALRFEEIQNFNITLQERIERATGQLRHTNERLRLLDQTKDDFISMASHQLRTPLTSVKGYLSMVLDGDVGRVTQQQKKLLDQAFFSSQRMVFLIADLLNVSRLKTGKFVLEENETNLAAVVEEEISQLQETAKARELKLSYEKPKNFPTLTMDETKIRQVIMNFVDNAIYYTPKGGHIVVKLTDSPHSITLTVTDDGIGVPKSEQHHLFTKFYRAGNARKARPDGTGLGLFMAKKVIIAQGGSILFKSHEGRGSTFGFTLAKAKLQPAPHSAPAADKL